jgi:hypothetical protein
MSSLAVTFTFPALASTVTEVLAPFALNLIPPGLNELRKTIQLGAVELVVIRHRNRPQPKLGVPFRLHDVHVNGFVPFIAKKEKSMTVDYKQSRQFRSSPILHF